MSEWYLNKSAAGSNNGQSLENGWTGVGSISWASIVSGDTFWLAGGNYNEAFVPINKNGVTYKIHPSSVQPALFTGITLFNTDNSLFDGLLNNVPFIIASGKSPTTASAFGVVNSSRLTVRGVEATRLGFYEAETAPHHGMSFNTCDYCVIEKCFIHHAGGDGLNIIAASPTGDFYDNFVVSGNTIVHIADDGIQLGCNRAVTVVDNYIDNDNQDPMHGGHPDGIQLNPNGGNIKIYNNTIRGFNQNIFIEWASKNIFIYNNSLIGFRTSGTDLGVVASITFTPTDARSTGAGGVAYDAFTGAFVVSNNVFYNFVSNKGLSAHSMSWTTGLKVFKNNIFYDCKAIVDTEGTGLLDSSNIYYNSPGIQYYSSDGDPVSFPTNQTVGGCTSGDPGLRSVATYDFYPSGPSSMVVDAGVSLSEYFTRDITGTARPQGAAWDIGPFEYVFDSATRSFRRLGRNPKLRGLSPN